MRRVLVIDDDAAVGAALQRVLARAGHRVALAERAEAGLALLRAEPFDVAIVDMVMPQMDGAAAIRIIAAEFPALRIVASSGGGGFSSDGFRPQALNTTAFLAAARAAGAHATLSKPFQLRELLLAIGCRVMVVDDEPTIRSVLARVLERAGYHVRTAAGGAEALAALRSEGAEILVTDLLMPGLNGVDLVRVAAREMPGMRIVAISGGGALPAGSGLAATPHFSAAREAGAHALLAKPFEVRDLLAAVGFSSDAA